MATSMASKSSSSTTKDGGVKSKVAVAAAIVAFNKKKGKMDSKTRKKVAARLKSLKQQQGQKGALKGE